MTDTDLAATIRQARLDAGLTQLELAHLMGVSQRSVENWEQGVATPRPLYLQAVRRTLKRLARDRAAS